jgi:hypothetical protein
MRGMRGMRRMRRMKKRGDTERGEGRIFCLSFSASPRPRVSFLVTNPQSPMTKKIV